MLLQSQSLCSACSLRGSQPQRGYRGVRAFGHWQHSSCAELSNFLLDQFLIDQGKEILSYEGGEALAQVAQRSCGCPLPGSVQGKLGWVFEQPGLVEGVPAHSREIGTR